MDSKLQHYTIIFVVFMINSYNTFATWSEPPPVPTPKTRLDCKEWILFYDFSENNTDVNRNKALARNRDYDTDVSWFAAHYALILCSFHTNGKFLPSDYCEEYGGAYYNVTIETIPKHEWHCTRWIRSTGFHELDRTYGDDGEIIEPETLNWRKNKNRNKTEDKHLPIWTALYVRLLDNVPENQSISVPDFCKGIGQGDELEAFQFLTLETKKTCKDWIHFAGYTGNLAHDVVLVRQSFKYESYTNTWAQRYGEHLYVDSDGAPKQRSRGSFKNDYLYYFYLHKNPYWLSPSDFCKINEGRDTHPMLLYNCIHNYMT